MISLEQDERDAPAFLERISTLISGEALACHAESIYIIKIDNWFSQKWLGFSHKMLGTVAVHRSGADLAVPPFKPSRVRSEQYLVLEGGSHWTRKVAVRPVHLAQPSEENRHRRIHELFPRSALFWWSASSKMDGRGALMAYVPTEGYHGSWYAQFYAQQDWRESGRIHSRADFAGS